MLCNNSFPDYQYINVRISYASFRYLYSNMINTNCEFASVRYKDLLQTIMFTHDLFFCQKCFLELHTNELFAVISVRRSTLLCSHFRHLSFLDLSYCLKRHNKLDIYKIA